MKKLLIFIALAMLLYGCQTVTESTTTTSQTTTSETISQTTSSLETTTEISTDLTTISETMQTTTVTSLTTSPTTLTTTDATTEATTETTTQLRYQEITLYSINDFHGGAYTDIWMLESMGAYLKHQLSTKDNTILLTNGDILQGGALSNYYYGDPIIEVLNEIGNDGFVIGNHEFDWGIDIITAYKDGNPDNGEMDYPLLAANIVYIDTNQPLENTVPYIIKDIDGVKVGIIGVIGDVINSIAASRTQNITFLDPEDSVYQYAEILRTTEDCDIVVVYIHGGSGSNYEIAGFTGNHYVDAVFNGHTHRNESGTISRDNLTPLVYAQASNYSDSLFVSITLTYDLLTETVVTVSAETHGQYGVGHLSDSVIEGILNDYASDPTYVSYVSQILANVESSYGRSDLAGWGASVIRDYAGVDIGALNSGGFRTSMASGELTMGDLMVIYPFDNYIKTSELNGAQLLAFYQSVLAFGYDVVFDDQLSYDGTRLFLNGAEILDQEVYTVGAVDYIFDKDNYVFLDGQNITLTNFLMRDLLVQDLLNTVGLFNPYNGTSYQDLSFIYDPNRDKRLILLYQ